MSKKIILKQDETNEIPVEVLADSIKAISEGIKKLRSGRLNDKALILLIVNAAPSYGGTYSNRKHVSAVQVKTVLDGMEQLEHEYLKPKKSKP